MAATDRFKQVVIMGNKNDMRGAQHQVERERTLQALMAVGQGEAIPSRFTAREYFHVAPINDTPFRFEMVCPDIEQLKCAFHQHQGLWSSFQMQFKTHHQSVPRPLRRLSPWHLSLSLAAGQIAGKVVSNDGQRILLVKGGTQKVQRSITNVDEHQTITTKVDQFQPLIRAIEFTPGEFFGRIVVIN